MPTLKQLPKDQADEVMRRLWDTMTTLYQQRWTSSQGIYGDGCSKQWYLFLEDLTVQQIQCGITATVQSAKDCAARRETAWPPTVMEFQLYCDPESAPKPLPDVRQAYQWARLGDWNRHPCVYPAALQVGTWDLKNATTDRLFPAFKAAYQAVCLAYREGKVLPLPQRVKASQNVPQLPKTPRHGPSDVQALLNLCLANLKGGYPAAVQSEPQRPVPVLSEAEWIAEVGGYVKIYGGGFFLETDDGKILAGPCRTRDEIIHAAKIERLLP